MVNTESGPERHDRTPPSRAGIGRRNFLVGIGLALNAIAAALLAVPLIGYLAGALRQRKAQAWIPLGDVSNFPIGQTRLAEYQNPFTVPWDGDTAHIPCWVRRLSADQF